MCRNENQGGSFTLTADGFHEIEGGMLVVIVLGKEKFLFQWKRKGFIGVDYEPSVNLLKYY